MRLFLIFLLNILLLVPITAAAEDKPSGNVMIVLDASGSMWGQIDGKAKITIAREVIDDMVSSWDENVRLGLIAYGHRKKGDCSDIQVLIPVGTLNRKDFIAAVNGLQPKGKTPLSQAVKDAAHAMRFEEDKATVILVSDGKETCNLDPCAVGTELESLGVDFTAHVIGFDVKKEERAGLECLARNTGGEFLPADNAGELQTALGKTVVEAKKVTPGIRFQAVVTEDQEPITSGLGWSIYETAQQPDGSFRRLSYSYNAQPFITLPAGKYRVDVKWGSSLGSKEFEVREGESQTETVILGAGTLRANAVLSEGREALSKDVSWEVFSTEQDVEGKRKKISFSYNASPLFKLPAGDYYITAKVGWTSVGKTVSVTAGKLVEETFDLRAGNIKLTLALQQGDAPLTSNISWSIYTDTVDVEGKREKIAYSYDAQPLLTLAAGSYYVTAQTGNSIANKTVAVTQGQLTSENMVLGAGKSRFKAILADGGEAIGNGVSWSFYSEKNAAGEQKKVAYSYDAVPLITLPTGRYVASASYRQTTVSAPFEVKSGELVENTLVLNAGSVRVNAVLSEDSSPLTSGVSWNVYTTKRDASGNQLKTGYSYDAAPTFTLPMGNYDIIVQTSNGTAKAVKQLSVTAGQFSEETLNLNAGTVEVSLLVNGSAPGSGVSWNVYESQGNSAGDRKKAAYSYDKNARFVLPAGHYQVIGSTEGKSAKLNIDVVAGKFTKQQLIIE